MERTNINWVVEFGLCTRCGACQGICPNQAIQWDRDFFPRVNSSCDQCGLCVSICGGIGFNYVRFSIKHYGAANDFVSDAIGPARYTVATHSTDPHLRSISSSGGLASQIPLSLMAARIIDGSVVTGFDPENPVVPTTKIARTSEEIFWGVQSKYVIFPVAHVYREIIETPGNYCVVGLPCQIHSLLKWQRINSKLRERVVLIVGLCCHANLEIGVLRDLLAVKKMSPEQLEKLEFRGGDWPGGIRVTLKDGSILPLHSGNIKDGAFNYLKSLYVAPRCLLCPDYAADFADISISDPWIRNESGDYMFEGGWSIAHVRTERGEQAIELMMSRGELIAEPVDHSLIIYNNKSMTAHKKRGVFIRLERKRDKGLPVPEFGLQAPLLSRKNYRHETKFQFSLLGWHVTSLRPMLLKLAFSKFGETIKQCRARTKKLKHNRMSK